MTASRSAAVTAEEIIAFVRSQQCEVNAHQVAAAFGMRWSQASSRLSKLHAYGKLQRRFVWTKGGVGYRGNNVIKVAVYTGATTC